MKTHTIELDDGFDKQLREYAKKSGKTVDHAIKSGILRELRYGRGIGEQRYHREKLELHNKNRRKKK